ncbi:MAG: InlB B-repeat-containing protein [Clostridiales bacterium]|nr:InlB B-repeat-containing protein [Clostridiales bacterium]
MQKVVSTKRRKLVLSILLVVLAALGIFVFAACSDDVTEETFKNKGYKVSVTYDFQGGTYNNKTYTKILIKPNSKLPEPNSDSGGVRIPSRSGYSFKGFYLPETDADGNVVKDSNGNVIVSDTPWDFANGTIENNDITLYAKWWDNYKVVLHYGSDYSKSKEISLQRNRDGSPTNLSASTLRVDNYTFLSYNFVQDSENADTALNEFPYKWNSTAFNESDVMDVWGKSLDGNYVLVRSADDLHIAYVGETTNYYLLDDIDMGGATYDNDIDKNKNQIPKTYRGKFVGNGYTISNFKMTLRAADQSYDSFGLFRSLGDGAEITDVEFKDITLSYDLSNANIQTYYLGMLAGQSSANVVVNNVTFTTSEQGANTFEYMIGVGVTNDNVKIADDMLIAQKSASTVLQQCSVAGVKYVRSVAVVTADQEFVLYVKYNDDDGVITLDEDSIYALAQKNSAGVYEEKRIKEIEYIGTNKYKLTRLIYVYDIEFTINNGNISATMVLVS